VGQYRNQGSPGLGHLCVKALVAPFTVNTCPKGGTLKALADHQELGPMMPVMVVTARKCCTVRHGRYRHRCVGRAATGRRGQVVCNVLERTAGGGRVKGAALGRRVRRRQHEHDIRHSTHHTTPGLEGRFEAHAQTMRDQHLRTLFAQDPRRGDRMAAEAAGIYLDYSKNRITDATLSCWLQLAEESGLRTRIDAMFRGDKINSRSSRAVRHVALRAPRGASILVDGENVVPQSHTLADKMADFFQACACGAWTGHTVSDSQRHQHRHRRLRLGPVRPTRHSSYYSDRRPDVPFVSNIDAPTWRRPCVISIRRRPCSSSPRRLHDAGDQ